MFECINIIKIIDKFNNSLLPKVFLNPPKGILRNFAISRMD